MRELGPHFSNGVVELSGTDDHLHLKDVSFGHAPLHKTLQHLLLVQPDMSEKEQVWENTVCTVVLNSQTLALFTWSCLWGLRHRVSATPEPRSSPRDWMRDDDRGKNRKIKPAPLACWNENQCQAREWKLKTAVADDLQLPDEFPAQIPAVHASVPLVASTRHQIVITFLLLSDIQDKTVPKIKCTTV